MIEIDENEFSFSVSRSSGPGGQNVNKVNSRVTLTWDIDSSRVCHYSVKDRFKKAFKSYILSGKVVISSQKNRSQVLNKKDCITRIHDMINSVKSPPKTRRATKPTKSSVKKRLDSKSKHSKLKKSRREKW